MQQAYDFDTDVYFDYVAENLLRTLGPKALHYADEALAKMRSLDDEEGFDIWQSIQKSMTRLATADYRPDGVSIH